MSFRFSSASDYRYNVSVTGEYLQVALTKCMVEGRLFKNVPDVQNDNGWWSLWRGIKVIAVKR